MAPIKVGIIGLSANANAKWAANVHFPYLVSTRGKEKYEIVGVLNSSAESSRKAIESFNLPASTKAYGSPDELAADDDVQLVVDVTRVDVHYPTVLPSLKAGKDAFVEWPLADNIQRIRELAAIAREKKIRTAVGIQGRLTPVYLKVAEVLASGRIGKILSSEINSASNRAGVFPGGEYFADRKIGGNLYTIGLGHLIDSVQFILGELQDVKTHFQLQQPEVNVIDPKTGNVVGTVKSDVPDLVILTGSLPKSATVQEGATLTVRYRNGLPFKGEPAHTWTVYGESGQLRLVSPAGSSLQANVYSAPVTIEVFDLKKKEVTPVEWDWPDYQKELPIGAGSIAALYEAYAAGEESQYATFEDALQRHEQLESWISDFKTG